MRSKGFKTGRWWSVPNGWEAGKEPWDKVRILGILKTTGSLLIATIVWAAIGVAPLSREAEVRLTLAYLSPALAFLILRPSGRELMSAVLLAPFFAGIFPATLPAGSATTVLLRGLDVLTCFGLASVWVAFVRMWLDRRRIRDFLGITAVPFAMVLINMAQKLTVASRPQVLDLYLYRFDGLLGFQGSFLIGRIAQEWPAFYRACFISYFSIAPALALMLALYLRRSEDFHVSVPWLLVLSAVTGFILYNLFPAVGPAHVFDQFPRHEPAFSSALKLSNTDAPRNAMPSLHLVWAILLLWNLKGMGRLMRLFGLLFLSLTVVATLAVGEHYLVDLIVAVPFADALQTTLERRWVRAGAGGLITVAWILCLRLASLRSLLSPTSAWALVILTAAFAVVPWHARLSKRTEPAGAIAVPDSDRSYTDGSFRSG